VRPNFTCKPPTVVAAQFHDVSRTLYLQLTPDTTNLWALSLFCTAGCRLSDAADAVGSILAAKAGIDTLQSTLENAERDYKMFCASLDVFATHCAAPEGQETTICRANSLLCMALYGTIPESFVTAVESHFTARKLHGLQKSIAAQLESVQTALAALSTEVETCVTAAWRNCGGVAGSPMLVSSLARSFADVCHGLIQFREAAVAASRGFEKVRSNYTAFFDWFHRCVRAAVPVEDEDAAFPARDSARCSPPPPENADEADKVLDFIEETWISHTSLLSLGLDSGSIKLGTGNLHAILSTINESWTSALAVLSPIFTPDLALRSFETRSTCFDITSEPGGSLCVDISVSGSTVANPICLTNSGMINLPTAPA
jgi:hypothetical protein